MLVANNVIARFKSMNSELEQQRKEHEYLVKKNEDSKKKQRIIDEKNV